MDTPYSKVLANTAELTKKTQATEEEIAKKVAEIQHLKDLKAAQEKSELLKTSL